MIKHKDVYSVNRSIFKLLPKIADNHSNAIIIFNHLISLMNHSNEVDITINQLMHDTGVPDVKNSLDYLNRIHLIKIINDDTFKINSSLIFITKHL